MAAPLGKMMWIAASRSATVIVPSPSTSSAPQAAPSPPCARDRHHVGGVDHGVAVGVALGDGVGRRARQHEQHARDEQADHAAAVGSLVEMCQITCKRIASTAN